MRDYEDQIPQMSRTTKQDMDEIVMVMEQLWPRLAKRQDSKRVNLAPEKIKLWYRVCQKFPPEWVKSALRDYAMAAEEGNARRYEPHIGDIHEMLRDMARKQFGPAARTDGVDGTKSDRSEKRYLSPDEQRDRNDRVLSGVDHSELLLHKRTLMKQDWRLRFLAREEPNESLPLRSLIADRIRRGLDPLDFDPEREPPEQESAA